MQASLLQTEVKLTVTFIIMTTYFTGIVKCGLVLQQIKCQPFVLISKSQEIKLIFFKVKLWKTIRHKTDSEPLSQNLDQLNVTLLVFLARKIRDFLKIHPRNLCANSRSTCNFILTFTENQQLNNVSSRNCNKRQILRTSMPYFLMNSIPPSLTTPTFLKRLLHEIPSQRTPILRWLTHSDDLLKIRSRAQVSKRQRWFGKRGKVHCWNQKRESFWGNKALGKGLLKARHSWCGGSFVSFFSCLHMCITHMVALSESVFQIHENRKNPAFVHVHILVSRKR